MRITLEHIPNLKYIKLLPVLVYKQHSEVVRECGQYGLVCFEKNVSDGDRAVTQEAKLPLRVELLQKDKTMIGQLHTSTYKEKGPEMTVNFLSTTDHNTPKKQRVKDGC